MHAPTTAVLWQTWRRHRWVLIAIAVWFLVISSLSHALSDGVIFGMDLFVHKDAIIFMLLLAICPLICGLFPIFVYSYGADIASKQSIFPTRMFTLPITTRDLVGWPMLYGTIIVALTWLAVASFVLRPIWVNAPLWWPAFFLASCLAWIQAMSWRPFGLPGLRMVATVVPIVVLVKIASLCWMDHVPEPVVSLLLGCTILPAYVVALRGVARARRGDQPDWQWLVGWARNITERFSLRGKDFASQTRAQVWFEWRRHGLGFRIAAGLMILFLAMLITVARQNPLSPDSPIRSPMLLLIVPLFAAVAFGGSWGNCGNTRRGKAIPAFLATRPMTSAGLVWAKMKAAAICVAVVWGMTLAVVVLMVLWTGSWSELARHWNMLTNDFSTVQKAAMVTLGAVLLPAATWKPMISNMFWGLTGRTWVWNVGVMVMLAVLVLVLPFAGWLIEHQKYHAGLTWALRLAAALKLLLGAWLIRVIVRRRLIEARLVKRLLGAWLLTTASLTGLLCWLIPAGLASWHLITACVVLVMPLVRISLAPIALAWNRHR